MHPLPKLAASQASLAAGARHASQSPASHGRASLIVINNVATYHVPAMHRARSTFEIFWLQILFFKMAGCWPYTSLFDSLSSDWPTTCHDAPPHNSLRERERRMKSNVTTTTTTAEKQTETGEEKRKEKHYKFFLGDTIY